MKKYTASVEVPDDWEPKFGKYSVDFFFDRDIISTEMIADEWRSLDELPKEDEYILISFANFTLSDIGRMENGIFYPGDDMKSFKEYGLIVNGWRPLPRCKEG
jgi:hypothetical protein